jgi:hypothetical protein
MELIDYRWNQFAMKIHLIGFIFHLAYLIAISCFIHDAYVGDSDDFKIQKKASSKYLVILGILLTYNLAYDT